MKIGIVGPTHPYKGGIAQHTTELAHRLRAAGHEVEIISWKTQYPFFYPGAQFVPENKPELPPFPRTKRVLSWKNPAGWLVWGRRLCRYDQVIFVWWVPTIQGPVYMSMMRAAGKKGPRVSVVCHNVLPHEGRPGDGRLAKSVLGRADRVIVHSPAQADIASHLTNAPVRITTLPMSVASRPAVARKPKRATTKQLLFFGFVRPYKGLDVLLQALAEVPEIRLTIAGEFWGGTAEYEALIAKLNLPERVKVRNEYVPADDLAELISSSDAVVLPYREGTASWNTTLAFSYGTPVIVTTAGTLAAGVREGVDALLCKPGDAESLAAAIRHFYEPGVAQKLRQGVPKISVDDDWRKYTETITSA